MSFTPPPSLPPISTLSSVLDSGSNGSMVIAPELMGEEGLPPSIKRRASGSVENDNDMGESGSPQNHNSSGYQSSSARDERSGGWNGPGNGDGAGAEPGSANGAPSGYPSGRHQHPWEEGYREHQSPHDHSHNHGDDSEYINDDSTMNIAKDGDDQDQEQSDKPKPKKRARLSKPRQSKEKNGGPKDDGIPEDGVFDYGDPSGDFRLGPVFVHPPKGAAQACVRCHKIKRKCDNARPRCAGCSKADVACVFELSPATASYVSGLKTDNLALTSEIASAAERIQQLESAISSMERGFPPTSVEGDMYDPHSSSRHGMDVDGPVEFSPQADFASLSKSILAVRSNELANPVFSPVSVDTLSGARRHGSSGSPQTAFAAPLTAAEQQTPAPLPPYDLAMQAVETFFECNAVSYPFLDRSEFLRDLDEVYRRESSNSRRASAHSGTGATKGEEAELWAGKEFIFFMVIAIGTTNRERLGEVEKGSSRVFRRRAMLGLQAAVSREDILAVQALILLGIYSMFDPSGISLWHVVGFAARIAIALNLHRRVDDGKVSRELLEQRRRVFFSLYNLDRLVAVTLSKPLAIADNDIDVELPSSLPTDEPFRGRPRIEFTQHIIKLRRLSGIILSTVYSVSGEQNSLPESERANIIIDLHAQLDSWLSECPLPPDTEEEKRGMITNHSWFLLNYHQGLCLLYRPSPLYPVMTADRLRALHEASTRCVDLYLDLWQDRKVSYNLINVSMQFLACISLLYCLCEHDSRDPKLVANETWRKEVGQRLGQCHDLLEAFSRALPETAKYREVFTKLSELLLARYGPMPTGSNRNARNSSSTSNSARSTSTSTMTTVTPAISSTGVDASAESGGEVKGSEEGEAAWNAMTQLWHNSGEFAFDERALNAIHPLIQGHLNQSENMSVTQIQRGMGNAANGESGSRDNGLGSGLWNQLG